MTEAWKATLFIWKGLITKTNDDRYEWNGTWIGVQDDQMPSDDDFKSSNNTFNMKGSLAGQFESILTWEEGSYLLDNGNGLESYKDESHTTLFYSNQIDKTDKALEKRPQNFKNYLYGNDATSYNELLFAIGEGSTQFGAFQSKGMVEKKPNGVSLTFARRYLPTKGDVRGKVRLEDCITRSDLMLDKPWLNLPVKIKANQWKDYVNIICSDESKNTNELSGQIGEDDVGDKRTRKRIKK